MVVCLRSPSPLPNDSLRSRSLGPLGPPPSADGSPDLANGFPIKAKPLSRPANLSLLPKQLKSPGERVKLYHAFRNSKIERLNPAIVTRNGIWGGAAAPPYHRAWKRFRGSEHNYVTRQPAGFCGRVVRGGFSIRRGLPALWAKPFRGFRSLCRFDLAG